MEMRGELEVGLGATSMPSGRWLGSGELQSALLK